MKVKTAFCYPHFDPFHSEVAMKRKWADSFHRDKDQALGKLAFFVLSSFEVKALLACPHTSQ